MVHRDAALNAWGRPLDPSSDLAGVCKYEAPTRDFSGRMTKPPKFNLFSYWGKGFPQPLLDGFEKIFPGTGFYVSEYPGVSSRKPLVAKTGPARTADWDDDLDDYEDDGEANVYKWVWADGYPTLLWKTDDTGRPWHDEAIKAQWYRDPQPDDVRGYAVQNDDGRWEIETYGLNTNNQALQDAKRALIAEIPDADIAMPLDFEDTGSTTVVSYAPNTDRHEAAALWAQENLGGREEVYPEDIAVSPDDEREFNQVARKIAEEHGFPLPEWQPTMPPEGHQTAPKVTPEPKKVNALSRLFKRVRGQEKEAGADHEGVMVAVYVPKDVAKQIALKGGEPVEDLHITLAYFEDKAAERDDWDEMREAAAKAIAKHPKLYGKVGGIGIFYNDEGDVLWASVSIPGLAELRDDVVEAVEKAGFSVSKEHGWVPHVTLKYDFKGKPPRISDYELEIESVTSTVKRDREDHPLAAKSAGWEDDSWEPQYRSWSGWNGALRFVTDGKDIITESEPLDGGHGRGHSAMETEFLLKFEADPNKRLTSGWLVPTANGDGYGAIINPGSQKDLSKVWDLLEQHTGKPVHLTERQPKDPAVYAIYPEGGNMVPASDSTVDSTVY